MFFFSWEKDFLIFSSCNKKFLLQEKKKKNLKKRFVTISKNFFLASEIITVGKYSSRLKFFNFLKTYT